MFFLRGVNNLSDFCFTLKGKKWRKPSLFPKIHFFFSENKTTQVKNEWNKTTRPRQKEIFPLKCSSLCVEWVTTLRKTCLMILSTLFYDLRSKQMNNVNIQYVNVSPCFLLPRWISRLSDVRIKPQNTQMKTQKCFFFLTLYRKKSFNVSRSNEWSWKSWYPAGFMTQRCVFLMWHLTELTSVGQKSALGCWTWLLCLSTVLYNTTVITQ